jgi:hypothetical protein
LGSTTRITLGVGQPTFPSLPAGPKTDPAGGFNYVTGTRPGTLVGPAPKVNDLVRIMTGMNASSDWRRITTVDVALHYIEVDALDAFVADPNPFTFAVAISAPSDPQSTSYISNLGPNAIISGVTFVDTGTGSTPTDSLGPFVTGPVTILANTYGQLPSRRTATVRRFSTTSSRCRP